MKLYEYQAKEILKDYGIPVPKGIAVDSLDAGSRAAEALRFPLVIKAQVHAGGRGKAGAIKVVANSAEFTKEFSRILGMEVKGLKVKKILLEQALDLKAQWYLGLTLDRSHQGTVIIASREGGIDIEEVAATDPKKIRTIPVDKAGGLAATDLSSLKDFESAAGKSFRDILASLYAVYEEIDAQLVEINPLSVTGDNELVACDAKVIIDDNALFRHDEFDALIKEASEDNELEIEAHRRGLAYVKLSGNVGIIGNGAGLVMATMDEVKRAGGLPANFLDIGGGAKSDVMKNSLEILYKDKEVQGIFINIFGGITRCDEVARGIVQAIERAPRPLPIVLRLIGTQAEEGREILKQSKLVSAATMEEGAQKIVAAINK